MKASGMKKIMLAGALVLIATLLPQTAAFGEIVFCPEETVQSPYSSLPIYSADFDNDGDWDLAVGSDLDVALSILISNGDGTFEAPRNYTAGLSRSISGGDLVGDSALDLVMTCSEVNVFSLYRGLGDGSFQIVFSIPTGVRPWGIAVDDFNGDGDNDVAVANYSQNNVYIYDNVNGNFTHTFTYDVGSNPGDLESADIDLDGDSDLIVANTESDNLAVLRSHGNGSFEAAVFYSTGDYPMDICPADLDGDSDIDLAVSNFYSTSSNMSILFNGGAGIFGSPVLVTDERIYGITAADFDNDGDKDLASTDVENSEVLIFENTGTGNFHLNTFFDASYPRSVISPDVDGDGDNDLAVVWVGSNRNSRVAVRLNDPSCLLPCCLPNGTCDTLSEPACAALLGSIHEGPCLGDINGNGKDEACEPIYGCCLPDGGCSMLNTYDCQALGGTTFYDTCRGDANLDGINDACQTLIYCCLPDGGCGVATPESCLALGGEPYWLPCAGDTDGDSIDERCDLPNNLCDCALGDMNGNGTTNGIDVVYSVSYFKGGPPPPVACDCYPIPFPFYGAGDVNGDCTFNGIDIVYFVNYFKGLYPWLVHCPSCAPLNR